MSKNKLGYKKNSPYKNEPYIDIQGNNLTMQSVEFPILAVPNNNAPTIMYPGEEHYFPNSNKVREIPMKNMKSKYKKGGKLDHTKALQAYLESLSEEEQDRFVDHYDSLPDNDKDDLVTRMVMRDGGMYQKGGNIPTVSQRDYTLSNGKKSNKDIDNSGRAVLKKGMKEELPGEITQLQAFLQNKGFYTGKQDGVYGDKTEAAVKKYQKWFNENAKYDMKSSTSTGTERFGSKSKSGKIKEDGVVGDQTRTALMYRDQNPAVSTPKQKEEELIFPNEQRVNRFTAEDSHIAGEPDGINFQGGFEMLGLAGLGFGAGAAIDALSSTAGMTNVARNVIQAGKNIPKAMKPKPTLNPTIPKGSPQMPGGRYFGPKTPSGYGTRVGYQDGGNIPTYPQVPDNQGVVEVEGKETVLLTNGELNKFEGPTHAQGGIPTNLPEGSKIFSHYLKPDPKIVETVLGKKAKPGLSYADLSKKFPTKKWENILNSPDTDKFQKNTAQVKIEKNKAMLETIFQAQELDKGVETDQQYMQSGGELNLSGISDRFEQLPNGLIIDPVTNKQMKRLANGSYQVVGNIPEIREKERRPLPQIEADKTRVQINPKPLDPFQNFINEQQNPISSYLPTTSDKFPSLKTETALPDLNYQGKDSLPARNTVAEPVNTRVQINPRDVNGFQPTPDKKSPIGPGRITWDFSDISNRFEDRGNGSYFDPVKYGKVDRNFDGTYIVQEGPHKGTTIAAPNNPTTPNKIRPKGKGKNPINPTAPVQDAEPITIPLPFDMLNNPVQNRTVASMNTSNPQPTPINPVTQQQIKSKDKGSDFDFGIDSKLAGTILDIGLALSDNIKVRNPTYYDNQTYPLFSRFVEFDNKEAGRQSSLAIQQIQNSNMPEAVKQAQIANITAQTQNNQSQVNFNNQQRYENKLEGDTNKLQQYLDRNVGVRNQDFDSYLQRKARVDDLYSQFKAQQKSRVVNSGIDYLNYVDDTNKKNILTSDNYRYNPVTGKIRFKESQKDPLKEQEDAMSLYKQNAKNAIPLQNGASMTMIGNNMAVVVGADGKAQVVDLNKK